MAVGVLIVPAPKPAHHCNGRARGDRAGVAGSDGMDEQQFDRLARCLGQGFDRRRLTGVVTGLGLATALGSPTKTEAKRNKKKKKKPSPSCPGGTALCGGTCVNTATDSANCGGCGRVCAVDRPCSQGRCTCSLDSQCARDRDPAGFDCLNSVTNPFCGCRPFTGQNRRVCPGAAGEACSVCCSDEECQATVPDLPTIICATPSLNGTVGRSCCNPPGAPCSNNCCAGFCSGAICGCKAAAQPCGQDQQCCSNQCGTQANPNGCA